MSVKSKAARVLADDTDADTLRLEVQSPRGDFTLEFAVDAPDGPVWNVADAPLALDSEDYVVLERGRNFYLLGSGAEHASDVPREAADLVERIGGPEATIYASSTFERWTGPPMWLTARGWATRGHDLLTGGSV